jgi:hypothetical protein
MSIKHKTPEQRLERIGELLAKGVYLYAKTKGWLSEADEDQSVGKPRPQKTACHAQCKEAKTVHKIARSGAVQSGD